MDNAYLQSILVGLVHEVMWIKAELKHPGIAGDEAIALVESLQKEFLESCAAAATPESD